MTWCSMPVKTKTESWVQTFREQLKSFMAPKAAWYVQESRGKIRLLVNLNIIKPKPVVNNARFPPIDVPSG